MKNTSILTGSKAPQQEPGVIASLDIGCSWVKMAVARVNEHNRLDVLAVCSTQVNQAVRRGEIENVDEAVKAIGEVHRRCEQQSGLAIAEVYVGFSGQSVQVKTERSIITRPDKDKEIDQHDLDRLKQDVSQVSIPEGHEILHILPQYYTVDRSSGIRQPIGFTGLRLECSFLMITANSQPMRNLRRCVVQAGLGISKVMLQSLAASKAMLTPEEKEGGVCLLDIGAGVTDMIVICDDVVQYAAVIPFGGRWVTTDLIKAFSVSPKDAELIKRTAGSALGEALAPQEAKAQVSLRSTSERMPREISRATLAKIVQSRCEELFEFVLHRLYEEQWLERLNYGVMLTGGGARLTHLEDLASLVLGMDVRQGSPLQHLQSGLRDEVGYPEYAVLVGLLVQGLEDNPHVDESQTGRSRGWLNRSNNRSDEDRSGGVLKSLESFFRKHFDDADTLLD